MLGVKALIFDMFGTVLDWRASIAREAEAVLGPRDYRLDWLAFADAWRGEYDTAMDPIRQGQRAFVVLDALHRESLERVLPRFGVENLPEAVAHDLNRSWHRLDAWPDAAPGMAALGRDFLLAPCSNGNIAMMVNIARRNRIRFDAILGAETARDYKPKPRVYLQAAEAFGLAPQELMMVCAASHNGDLTAAATQGLRTAAIARPDEFGPGTAATTPSVQVDVIATDLIDLAQALSHQDIARPMTIAMRLRKLMA